AQGGEARELGQGMDRRVSLVKWRTLGYPCVVFADHGRTIVSDTVESKWNFQFERPGIQLTSIAFSRKGLMACTLSDPTHASEVYADAAGGPRVTPKKLTNVNGGLLAQLGVSEPIEFKFVNESLNIQAWLAPPINLDEKKKYPVILSIHGGPHGMHGYAFNPT